MGRALSVIGVPTSAAAYSAALEGLSALNETILRADPTIPRLYESGVRYTKEATDKWRPIVNEDNPSDGVLATKDGDCEALSTWRVAELRVSGEDPRASVVVYPTGRKKYHAIVLRGDGSVEDPSILLGMKAPAGLVDAYEDWNAAVAAAPAPEAQPMIMGDDDADVACAIIGADDECDDLHIAYDVVGTDDGFEGRIRIPIVGGRAIYARTSTSGTEREATEKAHRVLGVIGAFWDDVAALLPSPEAQAAIRIAKNQHVQNLAKDAYRAGSRVLSHGGGRGPGPVSPVVVPDSSSSPVLPGDRGDLVEEPVPYDSHGAFDAEGADMATDVVEVNGVLCGLQEIECLGVVNDQLARGSRPTVGAGKAGGALRSGGGGGGGGGRPGLFSGGGGGGGGGRPGLFSGQGGPQRTPAGAGAPTPAGAASPGPMPLGPRSIIPPVNTSTPPYASPGYGTPYPFGPQAGLPGVNPATARAMGQQQFQRQQQADQMLSQPGGGGGGGGGGSDYDGGYTAADAAASAASDADLFNAYYAYQGFQDAENAYFDSAVEASPDAFFGAVNPYEAAAMLADDSIPAQ